MLAATREGARAREREREDASQNRKRRTRDREKSWRKTAPSPDGAREQFNSAQQ